MVPRIVVFNEDTVKTVLFSWRWGEDELRLIVDQYTCVVVEI